LLSQTISSSKNGGNRFFYGYIIAASSILLQVVMWGLFNTYGIFFVPMQDEFGWSRAAISGARSFSMFVWGFMSIVLGNLNDRFGSRILMTICGCFLGLGYLLMSQVNTLWQLYFFYGIVVGLGVSGTDVVILSTVARWFIKKRGMMTGIVKVGTGFGMFIMPLLANSLIDSQGWRNSYMILAIFGLVLIVVGAQFMRKEPGQVQQVPDGAEKVKSIKVSSTQTGLSLHEAIRAKQLWTMATMYLAIWFCVNVVLVHVAPHAMDMGISPTRAAGILSAIGGISIAGRLFFGTTSDRIGCKKSIVLCCMIVLGAFVLLLFASNFWMLVLFAVIYGFAHGGFATLISPLVGELFGLRSHGTILGVVIFFGTIGGAISPVFAGYLFDTTHSYQLVFIICIIMAAVGLTSSIVLRPVISNKS